MNGLSDEKLAQISAYAEGEMPADERAAFEAELAANAELAAALADYREAMGLTATLAEVHAPPDFEQAVQRTLRRRSRGRLFKPEAAVREAQLTQFFIAFALLVLVYLALSLGLHRFEQLLDDQSLPIEGSGQAAPPSPAVNEPVDDPGASGLPAPSWQLAREGVAGDVPSLPMRHEVFVYRVQSELDAESLATDLFTRFGPSRLRREGDVFYVTVAPAEFQGMAERLTGVGPVQRDRLTLDAPPPNHVFTIYARGAAPETD